MFALEVEYLTGRAVATDRIQRDFAEWPPHPQRLFSALVAAWAECDLGDDARSALEWLEQLPPPELRLGVEFRRDIHPVYVPVNDSRVPTRISQQGFSRRQIRSGREVLPDFRNRQERFFPTIVPDDPIVHFVWRHADGADSHRVALEKVAAEVTYLGHSSSPVRVAVTDPASILPTLRPAESGERRVVTLRVPSPGRMRTLIEKYQLSLDVNRRIEPPDGRWVPYTVPCSRRIAPSSHFGRMRDWIVFELRSRQPVPLSKALQLTYTIRRTLLKLADEAGALPNELLSGHDDHGSPIDRPHVAIVPLPFVGRRHATGEVKGIAIVLPEEHTAEERRMLLKALNRLHRIYNGRLFECELVRHTTPSSGIRTLDPETWIGERSPTKSPFWASVTPMIFGHHPGRRFDSAKTRRVVSDCCRLIGLPEPRAIYVSGDSKHYGVPLAKAFDTLTVDGKPCWLDTSNRKRLRAHVTLEFHEPVTGPIILGAGRYYGMGFCRPWHPRDSHGVG